MGHSSRVGSEVVDPRGYSQGTESALALLSRGTCYAPGCDEPTIRFLDGQPVCNLQRTHIRGALEGSPRYDPSMTDDERRDFSNIILLCKPHHDLIDRRAPADYPVELLTRWKQEREGADLSVLRSGIRGLTEERFAELLEAAYLRSGPQRSAVLEVRGGVFLAEGGGMTLLPIDGWQQLFDLNPHLAKGERCLVVIIRNEGDVTVTVEDVGFYLQVPLPQRSEADPAEISLQGRNDYWRLNPPLPYVIRAGEPCLNWLTSLDTIMWCLAKSLGDRPGLDIPTFRFGARLSSGETLSSERLPIRSLPMDRATGWLSSG